MLHVVQKGRYIDTPEVLRGRVKCGRCGEWFKHVRAETVCKACQIRINFQTYYAFLCSDLDPE